MRERRAAPRVSVIKGGLLSGTDIFEPITCTVRDLSASGALIRTTFPAGIPDLFDLQLVAENVSFACRVAWRRGDEMGVEFLGVGAAASAETCPASGDRTVPVSSEPAGGRHTAGKHG